MTTDDRKGLCAAFGCPLMGTMSASTLGDGKFYCACHFGKTPGANDAITARLNAESLKAIGNACRDIREFYGTDEWPVVYRGIQNMLKRSNREELLFDARTDSSPRGWLYRLEREVVNATREAGTQARLEITKPVAVVGPTHVAGFHPYADGVEA